MFIGIFLANNTFTPVKFHDDTNWKKKTAKIDSLDRKQVKFIVT